MVYGVGIYYLRTQRHRCLSEFVSGLRDTNKCKVFTIMFLTRKIILVVWVVVSQGLHPILIASVASLFQILYTIWLIVMRPFKEVSNNLVEIINEIIFAVVLGWLIIFSTESMWSGGLTSIYMYILVANNLVIVAVLLMCLFVNVVLKIKRCLTKKSQVDTRKKNYVRSH